MQKHNAQESAVEKTCDVPGGSSVLFHTITAGSASTGTSASPENSSKELQIVSGQYQKAQSEADALFAPGVLCGVQREALPRSSYEAMSHHSRLWDPPGSNWDRGK